MTEKTAGVVLTTIALDDHTQMVHVYTERFGKVSCRWRRSRRAAGSRGLMAPLAVVDLVVSRSPGADVMTVREAALVASPYEATMLHPSKAAQCFYMAELVDRTVREVEANARLWTFLRGAVELLALADDGAANFHLVFTTRLCYLLGFRVDVESYEPGMMFDVSEGVFTRGPIYHPYYLQAESAAWLHRLLSTDFGHLADLRLGRTERGILLDMMLSYLHIHMPEMGTVRSAAVLKTLYE